MIQWHSTEHTLPADHFAEFVVLYVVRNDYVAQAQIIPILYSAGDSHQKEKVRPKVFYQTPGSVLCWHVCPIC